MPKLTDAERDAFLDEAGILMRIATVAPDGRPLVVPIWFIRVGDEIRFTPRRASEWLGHIRENPDVALCIDEQNAPYRKVVVRGRARIVHELGEDDAWRDLYRRIARRYVPPRGGRRLRRRDRRPAPRAARRLAARLGGALVAHAARGRKLQGHLGRPLLHAGRQDSQAHLGRVACKVEGGLRWAGSRWCLGC